MLNAETVKKLEIIIKSNDKIIAKYAGDWHSAGWDLSVYYRETECGTVGCAIGNVAQEFGVELVPDPDYDGELQPANGMSYVETFTEILGISEDDYHELFLPEPGYNTPYNVNDRIRKYIKDNT